MMAMESNVRRAFLRPSRIGFGTHDYGDCSRMLSLALAPTGARALTLAWRRPLEMELVGASAGASIAFINLCSALGEAPVNEGVRERSVSGLGRLVWKAVDRKAGHIEQLVIFGLYDEDADPTTVAGIHNFTI
jgi:hypothetical protein